MMSRRLTREGVYPSWWLTRRMGEIREAAALEGEDAPAIRRSRRRKGWYWTKYTYRFGHGGWVFFDWRKPGATARWLWRFRSGPA